MKKLNFRLILLTVFCMLIFVTTAFAGRNINHTEEQREAQRAEIRQMSKTTLEKLYKKYPSSIAIINDCYGYATLSNANMNVILVSSSHGRGVAYNKKTNEEVFMRMKEIGLGFGGGIREFDLVFVFENEDAWTRFISGKTKLGGTLNASLTDGKRGVVVEGATLASRGIWIYQMTTKGLSLEATLNGTKYYTDKKLNKKHVKNVETQNVTTDVTNKNGTDNNVTANKTTDKTINNMNI